MSYGDELPRILYLPKTNRIRANRLGDANEITLRTHPSRSRTRAEVSQIFYGGKSVSSIIGRKSREKVIREQTRCLEIG